MRRLGPPRFGALLSGLALAAPAFAEPAGYTLEDEWDGAWIRLGDRSGRADYDGPLLQRFGPGQGPEYPLNAEAAEFRLRDERSWVDSERGARFWIQSIDEFTLANRVQLKVRAPMGGDFALGLRFDRTDDIETRSSLFRCEFLYENWLGEGTFAAISMHPRWTKDDSDAEARVGWSSERWGRAALRLFWFDPFVDASYALLESRGGVRERHYDQLGPELGLALELASIERKGVRGELYFGRLFPARTRVWHPAAPDRDYLDVPSAWLAGGLLEVRPFRGVVFGADAQLIDAESRRELVDPALVDVRVQERTFSRRLYAFWDPMATVQLDGSLQWLSRPESNVQTTQDESRMAQLLLSWMPLDVFGGEVGFMRLDRETVGKPGLDGAHHRIVTRFILSVGATWWSFGTGWDVDGEGDIYDGSGMTMRAAL